MKHTETATKPTYHDRTAHRLPRFARITGAFPEHRDISAFYVPAQKTLIVNTAADPGCNVVWLAFK